MNEKGGNGTDKRLWILYVLEILRKKSSKEHPLQREEILKILREDYDADCSTRTLSNYIRILKEDAYPIWKGGKSPIVTQKVGCYYEEPSKEFTDAELRMLIDGVLFSRNISKQQAKALIERLLSEGTHTFQKYWRRLLVHCDTMPYSDNEKTLENVGVVQKALAQERKISFHYNTYGTNFRLRPKQEKPYVFSPYEMILSQRRYYVAGNMAPHENVVHFRLDRMTDIAILKEPVKQKRQMKELKTTPLSEYYAQHIYMFSGKSRPVRLRTEEWMMDALVDWFGKEFKILKQEGGELEVLLTCNERAMKYWALQYGDSVEILEPKDLRESIAKSVQGMYERYCGEKGNAK